MSGLPRFAAPIVCAPMAGGPSTPELVAAVSAGGGFGLLAGGYLTAAALSDQIRRTRALTDRPFGVNLFWPEPDPGPIDLTGYAEAVAAFARDRGGAEISPGQPHWDDDELAAKLESVLAERPAVVTFTFGCPDTATVARLHAAGIVVGDTVTTRAEAEVAVRAGVDLLIVQGPDAGGHRGTHRVADEPSDTPLGDVIAEIAPLGVPIWAGGGLGTAAAIAGILTAGASAAVLGTMFLLCPEAGTNPTHRRMLTKRRDSVVTRAFTGRPARGLRTAFIDALDALAPAAYPQVHHLTAPIRRAAAGAGDAEALHLWAGTAHRRAVELPAAMIVEHLAGEL